MKKVMSVGLHPDVVDYSLYPGLTKEKLAQGLKAQEKVLQDLGFEVKMLLVDTGETAEKVTTAALHEKKYDAVVVGAGVRTAQAQFALFEKLINAIHEHAPQARICFNSRADDTADAILRWVKP
jgi:hypothetical protein